MDSLQEVSSTMTEETEVLIEIEVTQPHNGISLAEAANALITLQVPCKDSSPSTPVTSSENSENKIETDPKDFRKKILQGMKSQFNTSTEEDLTLEQVTRRGPHRSKSKFKREDESTEGTIKIDTPKAPRGRGRPPKVPIETSKPTSDKLKVENDVSKSEKESISEAGSERNDTATITRRSQRTNISRTSATDLLKGLTERQTKKNPILAPDVLKPIEYPRKRGRPAKPITPVKNETEVNDSTTKEDIPEEEDASKVEHMASLGLLSKSSPVLNSRLERKKVRMDEEACKETCDSAELFQCQTNSKDLSSSVHSTEREHTLVPCPLENEVEVSIVEDHRKEMVVHKMNDVVSAAEGVHYSCCCIEVRSPIATVPPAATLYCQAVDSVGGKLVGCCLTASKRRFYRPSKKIPFMILCDSHRDRIRKHFCCPGCGLFCTQGTFLQCKGIEDSLHFFHANCQRKGIQPTCPHCNRHDSIVEIRLQMKTCAVPVFCNDAKLLKTIPTAKMSLMTREELSGRFDSACPQYVSSQLVLPSGKVINSNGIPKSLNKDMLERILKSFECSSSTGSACNKSLFVAAKHGDIERVIECLRLGQHVNFVHQDADGQTALHAACFGGHLPVVHIVFQSGAALDKMDYSQNTPMSLALIQEHNDIVKYLIQAGASASLKGEGGMTALHLAAKYGNLEVCHYIMTLGNGSKFINAQDDGGWTPLVWGCEHQRFHIVKYLLQCKADPGVRDAEQNVALHWAAFSGSVDIVALLLDQGCQVNASNLHGDTPLHTASRRDNYECVLLLITRGGRLDLRNKDNQLAVEVCPDKHCHSALLLALNTKLQQFTQTPCHDAEKLLFNDITKGKESNPIQCVNGFDDDSPPGDFLYITDNCFTSPLHIERTINSLQFCQCAGDCSSSNCKCSSLSFRCWYDDDGKLVPEFNFNDPPMIFECNRACQCHRTSCNNRLVQHGITCRLVLFRVENKGWGVRASQPISKGSYVCEYIGEIITDFEADQREDDSYLFDLDNKDGDTYCIDARRYGNIARFVNHSCDPNLIPVKVFIDHQDLKFPRIAFFAVRDIEVNEELSFDYGDKFWIIKYKTFTCSCLSPKCKYSHLTIHRTVEEYRRCLQEACYSS